MNYTDGEYRELFSQADDLDTDNECVADYSSTGMCPCCGVELVTDTTFDEMSGLYAHIQSCESCGWESVLLYE
jgi:predicted RNA-binding Zn-ribbon protein involved in translation (DUF1610 family)